MLNRMLLSTRYRMIPGLGRATLYRKGANDKIRAQQQVAYVEFKTPGSSQSGSELGSSRSEATSIFLWVNELAGWKVDDFDIVHYVNEEQGEDSWWVVNSQKLEMMGTRYRCECLPTVPVDS